MTSKATLFSANFQNIRTIIATCSNSTRKSPFVAKSPFPQQNRPIIAAASSSSPQPFSTTNPKPTAPRIGVIGAGQMGEALIRGFIKSGVASPGKISASVLTFERREFLQNLGIGAVYEDATKGGALEVAHNSDVIILGVKPQAMGSVLTALAPCLNTEQHLIVSIAAGVKLKTLEETLGSTNGSTQPKNIRVVRVMPNTPCLIGQGASAYALGAHATSEDADLVHRLLTSVGCAIMVQEKMMDAVTGLSGSGPAYVYMMVEALADGGVAAGLPRDNALALAAKTVSGAAQMVFHEEEGSISGMVHPGILKDKVASPAGTTIAGIMELERSGVRGAFMRAVKEAAKRSEELG